MTKITSNTIVTVLTANPPVYSFSVIYCNIVFGEVQADIGRTAAFFMQFFKTAYDGAVDVILGIVTES